MYQFWLAKDAYYVTNIEQIKKFVLGLSSFFELQKKYANM